MVYIAISEKKYKKYIDSYKKNLYNSYKKLKPEPFNLKLIKDIKRALVSDNQAPFLFCFNFF